MAATPLERPVTVTGVELAVVVPSPSWPLTLFPQHFTLPTVVMAQVWREPKPAETTAALAALAAGAENTNIQATRPSVASARIARFSTPGASRAMWPLLQRGRRSVSRAFAPPALQPRSGTVFR